MDTGILNDAGIALIVAVIIGVGVYSGSKVKNAGDFALGGGRSGSLMVCGTIMGSLVSGQATVGTAQMAFAYGLSAWWFTLGAGLGSVVLALLYAAPLRRSGAPTLLRIIGREYGAAAESFGSVLCTTGIFVSVISQVIAASALLMTIFPLSLPAAGLISAALMALYVIFGGVFGAGMGGVVKLVLLYASGIAGLIAVMSLTGGLGALYGSLSSALQGTALGRLAGLESAADVAARYSSLVARGASKDVGSCISLVLGVLATQTYAQAIWSAKSDRAAKRGALLSGLLVPPIGAACTLIGLFMRTRYITSDEIAALRQAGEAIPAGMTEIASSAQAFPVFAAAYMPPLVGGIVLGTLLITVVGGGSGLSLGMATIVVDDILQRLDGRLGEAKRALFSTRLTIFVILLAAALIAVSVPGAIINDFGFLSMGLRGTVVFLPLTAALFMKGRFDRRGVLASMIAGPLTVLACTALGTAADPLFIGLAVCAAALAAGFRRRAGRI